MNWLILAIIVAGSVRLNLLVQAVPYGEAQSVHTAETSLSLFLAEADYPASVLLARLGGLPWLPGPLGWAAAERASSAPAGS